MQINESPEAFADVRKPREFTRSDCQRIASSYRRAQLAGRVKKPLSVFMAKIIHAAADIDR